LINRNRKSVKADFLQIFGSSYRPKARNPFSFHGLKIDVYELPELSLRWQLENDFDQKRKGFARSWTAPVPWRLGGAHWRDNVQNFALSLITPAGNPGKGLPQMLKRLSRPDTYLPGSRLEDNQSKTDR
jgi:hypothetical protein